MRLSECWSGPISYPRILEASELSVALARPTSAIYREEQHFAWWLYALLAVLAALGLSVLNLSRWTSLGWNLELPLPLLIGLGLPTLLVVGVLRMTTEVTPDACRVWFGWLPTYRRVIPLSSVRRVEIVRYQAIRDHGFWGVRMTRDGERVLTARGDRAVRLHLSDGSRVLIGTQRPEDLASVLGREGRLFA